MFVTASRYREALAERDAARKEADWLREQVATLQDHAFRLQRIQHGTTETPRVRKPKVPTAPWPSSLAEFVEGFESPAMRRDLGERIERMHASGTSHTAIEAVLRREYGIPEVTE